MSKKNAKHGEFCWNELITSNTKAAKTFYSALFGWEIEEHELKPEHAHATGQNTYTIFKQGETQIGGLMQTPKGQENHIPPHWGSYVNVDNLETTIEKAKSLGGKIACDITPVGDFGRLAVVQDPTGAYISLWESVKS